MTGWKGDGNVARADPRSRVGGDGWQDAWENGFAAGVDRRNENEEKKAPHTTMGPKQLTWEARGFLADPLQIPTPSRKFPAVSWP